MFGLKKYKLFVVICCLMTLLSLFLIHEIVERDGALARLELRLSQGQTSSVRRHLSQTGIVETSYFNDDDQIIIYNRVPKTGSTSFAGIAYELCSRNKFHVLHVNVTKNMHTLNIQDQMYLIQNMTEWEEKKPAMYHGHFYFIDFSRSQQSLFSQEIFCNKRYPGLLPDYKDWSKFKGVAENNFKFMKSLFFIDFDNLKNYRLGYNQRKPVYINIIRKPLDRLLSYYYFVRFGDNFRPHKRRRKQGNMMTFDDCVQKDHKDCDPVNLWLQIPFFCGHSYRCRQPGSRWALDQAKTNLINHYLLVGVTEELQDFIAMLEVTLPRFFRGASDMYHYSNRSHLRQTNRKEMPSEESLYKIQESTIWKMEQEFYEFALEQFHFQKRLTFRAIVDMDSDSLKQKLEVENQRTYMLSDGRFYIAKSLQFHYEKVRPR